MAKNNKKSADKNASEYYKLKTDAVEKLADASNAPVVSEKELKKYKSKGKLKIPEWLKVVFIKFWFGGAACYFFIWGLGLYLKNLDFIVVVSIGLGLVTDLFINHFLRFLEPEKGDYDKWMLITVRKFWSVFLNIIYCTVIFFCIMYTYNTVNLMINGETDDPVLFIGVEPLLFGLLYMGFDMLFIGIKNTFIKIFRDANKKASGSK